MKALIFIPFCARESRGRQPGRRRCQRRAVLKGTLRNVHVLAEDRRAVPRHPSSSPVTARRSLSNNLFPLTAKTHHVQLRANWEADCGKNKFDRKILAVAHDNGRPTQTTS